ncbi:type IV secretory system conjugative DNA transfer family protein [uncultured Salinicola sp.]|uniref:type IV secretory system conjugative DNA transfer family protein n=1 Tax=uncultured Salinicola sp. TaxID=1193542 RepID=UPI002611B177|nr:type IV secretory system conjugative DNA transfer family protein [uncultured Salinicola sp.]|tara:strand:- start:9552 stop:11687 length:2136 start_codon:yes stop_codon:yes gene_type:complete
MAQKIPTHYSSEKNKAIAVIAAGAFISFFLLIHLMQIAPIAAYAFSTDINQQSWGIVKIAFSGFYDIKIFVDGVKYAFNQNGVITGTMMFIAFAISIAPLILALALNPFRTFDLIHGDARNGMMSDVRKMEDRKQVGIKGAKYLHLGLWPSTKQPMRLIETLSCLVLAPPGTGKTASFVVPSILDTPESSFIINDPKPELFDLTSGYRAQIGPVFMINWSATDKIDPANLDDPTKTIFYPRFNPLSPKLLPPAGTAERDTYLDAVANVMSPSSGKGGGSNDYFEQKGRAALVGFLHYICSKVADPEEGQINTANIPSYWLKDGKDMEPSIPMLIDMINEGLRQASEKNDAEKAKAAEEQRFHQGDALADWLKGIVSECVTNEYNPRALTEITPLVSMAPNERSGVLGTMDKAFLPFKNAAVRERTSSCDFLPQDLRGMPDESGEMKPVTLYVCVNQAEAAAFATITSLLYEILSREYLAYGPGEVNRNNFKLGPYPVCFMLDEFAKLPKIEAVMTGPDLGRSKKTMYCLVAQSDSQIGKLYSKEDQQIIYATTAVKYILPQNDKDTIKLVQEMVGPTTIKRSSSSRSKGADIKEWGKSNESTNLEKVDFIRPGDISGMEPGRHIIMAQGFMNRPYFMKSVFFFKDPEMLAKAFNPRTGLGPKPAYPVPEAVRLARIEEWKRKNRKELKDGTSQKLAIDLEKYEDTPEPITA